MALLRRHGLWPLRVCDPTNYFIDVKWHHCKLTDAWLLPSIVTIRTTFQCWFSAWMEKFLLMIPQTLFSLRNDLIIRCMYASMTLIRLKDACLFVVKLWLRIALSLPSFSMCTTRSRVGGPVKMRIRLRVAEASGRSLTENGSLMFCGAWCCGRTNSNALSCCTKPDIGADRLKMRLYSLRGT